MTFRPYGNVKLEYGKFESFSEKNGSLRLKVDGNDYYSIAPEVGAELSLNQPISNKTSLKASAGVAYEYELGNVNDFDNKVKLSGTSADWSKLSGAKDKDGNFKFDVKLGVETGNIGVMLNGGYDTNRENLRGGIGIEAKF